MLVMAFRTDGNQRQPETLVRFPCPRAKHVGRKENTCQFNIGGSKPRSEGGVLIAAK
jgi:hypothetical protein